MEIEVNMEKHIRKHIGNNSLLILVKLLIVTATTLYFNYKLTIAFSLITVSYGVLWAVIYIQSKGDFKKYFKSMRKLMMVFIVFEAPNFFKFDFNPTATIKKEKYSYDSFWLYSYLQRREFQIEDKVMLENQVTKEMQHLTKGIRTISHAVLTSIVVSTIVYLFISIQYPAWTYTNTIYIIISAANIFALTHNLFMKALIRKNHTVIYEAFESKNYDKALRYSIIFLGMTKKSLYKTNKTLYLRTFESSYIY